jgi:hypothetical protein
MSFLRYVFGVICVIYASVAILGALRGSSPIDFDWLVKVSALLIVGLVIAGGPEVFKWVGSLRLSPRPTIFSTPKLPPLPAVKTVNETSKMGPSMTRTQLLVTLLESTKDPAIVESLLKISDSMLREDFKAKLPEKGA